MENWILTARKPLQSIMDLMLVLWTVFLKLHRRAKAAKKPTLIEDGLEIGYEPLQSTLSEGKCIIPIVEYQIKCSLVTEHSSEMPDPQPQHGQDETGTINETLQEPDAATSTEETEQADNADMNNNSIELDLRFTYSYDDDEDENTTHNYDPQGYEADSDSDGSDVEELSNDDATYMNFGHWSDDEVESGVPKRPFRIRPIERQMPVAQGLRISVLKQEARKALPIYFSSSRRSRYSS